MEQAATPPPTDTAADIRENKDIAALSYVWILSVPIYFVKRTSPFVHFHAKQGMVLFVISLFVWMIPFIGRLLELVLLGFAVFGFISAAQGKHTGIPMVHSLSRGDWKAVRGDWKRFVQDVGELFADKNAKPGAPSQEPQTPSSSDTTQTPPPPSTPQP